MAEQLQKSFDMAEETIKQRTAQAAEALVAKDYARAVSTMNQVVRNQRTLNGAQKEALDNLLAHARRAVEKDPSLNSRQLYTDTMALQLLLHPME